MRNSFPVVPLRHRALMALPFLLLSLLLSLLVLVLSELPARAQRAPRVRPAFEPKLAKKQTVAGIVRLRIVARQDGLPHEFAPIGSGGWAAVIRVDGHILASRTKLPAIVEWDTRKAGDGVHSVSVAVRNARADQEVGVEGGQFIVDNAAADTAAEAKEMARMVGLDTDTAARIKSPVILVPDTATVKPLSARFTQSANPLATRATALFRSGERLYIGLPDGGIAFCTPDTGASRGGSVIRPGIADGPTQSFAVGGGRVWWTTEGGRAIYAYNAAAHSVTRYDVTASLVPALPPVSPAPPALEASADTVVNPPVAAVTTDDAPPTEIPAAPPAFVPEPPAPSPTAAVETPKPIGWVRRVVILHGKVLLLGDGGNVRLLDPRSGKLKPVTEEDSLLPEEAIASQGDDTPRLFIASSGEGTNASALVVAVTPSPRPGPTTQYATGNGPSELTLATNPLATAPSRWRRYQLRAWRTGTQGAWVPITTTMTDADPDHTMCLAATPDALATAEREGLRLIDGASPRDLPYSLSPGMPSSTDRVTVGPSGLWWEQRGIVFRADPKTGARDAYLPWNVSDEMGAVLALAADKDSVWVATTSGGVRRIRPGRPTAAEGYNGYIRARLGAGTLRPPTPRDNRIATAIDAWQGVPYVWGGQSRSGADCSGFVMRMHQVGGVSIPRTSVGMRHTSQGKRVRDELHWGDTLVYPGHCGIYVGDGRTAETVGGSRGGSVSHSNIWVRSSVVVRRFLH
jgi:hypothetical protein